MNRIVFAFLMCLFMVTPTMAEDQPIVGVGNQSCGVWNEWRDKENNAVETLLTGWVQGFLSGMNARSYVMTGMSEDSMYVLPSQQMINAYLDEYCKKNVSDDLFGASLTLFYEIEEKSK